MQNNFYTKPKFNTLNTISKRKDSVLFLDYLGHFFAGPLLDCYPAFFADLGSNGIV
tara:strand:+ start:163 stop:330 length:168 start_codon:yes stop_codon:yes gene_type:complete